MMEPSVLLVDEALGQPVHHLSRSRDGSAEELSISQTILGEVMTQKTGVLTSDAASDDRFAGAHSVMVEGIRSAMCVPLLHQDEVLGVIYGDRVSTSAAYETEDIDFLAGIAQQVSIGLINARLVEEQQQMIRLNMDIDLARTIQTGLFPTDLPNRKGFKVAALNDPGLRVSGYYYDVIETDDAEPERWLC